MPYSRNVLPDGCPTCGETRRTLEQNSLMWALLTEVSNQVIWHGLKLSPDDWKDVLSASLKKQRAVPGIDGGFVILGMRTSKMRKVEMSELVELIYAFGAEQGVTFKEKEKPDA